MFTLREGDGLDFEHVRPSVSSNRVRLKFSAELACPSERVACGTLFTPLGCRTTTAGIRRSGVAWQSPPESPQATLRAHSSSASRSCRRAVRYWEVVPVIEARRVDDRVIIGTDALSC
jgi:hypothetical protein